ncbi:ATP-binding protein [Amaricoccus tamworthensis]|uniref:ATP-binding response regulator n=1 Tax=Amaricoccus tamworthensis TaxID=57002 RepID=UPI003C7BE777
MLSERTKQTNERDRMRGNVRQLAVISDLAAGLVALVVLLVGWGVGIDWIVRFGTGESAMVPVTAVCVLLLAVAQLIRAVKPNALLGTIAGAFAGTVVLICLWSYATGPQELPETDRMSHATTASLIIAAVSGMLPPTLSVRTWLATFGLIVSLIGLETYAVDSDALQNTPFFTGLSLQTSVCLLFLFLGQILRYPDRGWLATVTGDGTGSALVRKLLPLCTLAPLLLFWGALRTTEIGWIDPNFRLSVLALLLVLVLVVILILAARYQNTLDAKERTGQERLRAVLNALDTAVIVIGTPGTPVLTNKAADLLTGPDLDPETWLATAEFHAMDTREPLAKHARPFERLIERGETSSLFVGHVDRDHRERALHFTCARVEAMDASGPLHVLAVADESEGWILRENLSRGERFEAIGQLAGGIAHEVSNILGVIQISADTGLMKREVSALRHSLDTIKSACQRGNELVTRLTKMTRDGGVAVGRTDLTAVVRQSLDLVRASVPRRFELTSELPDESVIVAGDPNDVETALLNLILNARNAMVEAGCRKGSIHVSVAPRGSEVRLKVTDNGPGMPEDVLKRAVEPFFTTRSKEGGSGLGLSMVRNFARRIDGSFELDSTEGQGTEAVLTLHTVQPEEPAEPEVREKLDLNGQKIMIVESDPQFQVIVADAISVMGAKTGTAFTALEALVKMREGGPYDILMTNVGLAGEFDGYDLAVNAKEFQPELRVIYTTGYTEPVRRADRIVPGLVLRKPVSLEKLLNTVSLTLQH